MILAAEDSQGNGERLLCLRKILLKEARSKIRNIIGFPNYAPNGSKKLNYLI